jgi:2-polyprenyl-6-methoxyphenol hydroxylase-like FAD-dependent oxidoreductase
MKIAINGAGVAGPALAYWLQRSGHKLTLIEKSPHFRIGGYIIDFWGIGYTIAERMGICRKSRPGDIPFGRFALSTSRATRPVALALTCFAE